MSSMPFQVATYHYYDWSSRRVGKTNLILKGAGRETCSVWFVEDDSAELPEAREVSPNKYNFYYHQSQLQHFLEMLRIEKPVFVFFDNNGGNNSRISTVLAPENDGAEGVVRLRACPAHYAHEHSRAQLYRIPISA